ncbi:MAG: hypothetical protein KDD89_17025, partial [Anaerolineales bacterium]|nr:hypothetical protein [Anaerolineales bacterium]
LGQVEVPFDALYGAQTARAIADFPVSGTPIGHFPGLLLALARIKIAAARANAALGVLAHDKARLIEMACDEILSGQHHQHFPVDVFQGGAGALTNMNMNEVIANRGLELMGQPCGAYHHLHPIDDVNRSQSTNDVYPTALRIALLGEIPVLTDRLVDLAGAFERKGMDSTTITKLGRTKMQDALPITLGAEMRDYGVTV